jgi:ABC-2 type transport system ATP-binding protein
VEFGLHPDFHPRDYSSRRDRRHREIMQAITISQVSKAFGPVPAVTDLSFEARFGRITGFLGPNGAGKTTTLRILLRLVRPDRGTARLAGPAGAVLDAAAFHPGRTARVHLLSLCQAAGLPSARVEQTLNQVGLLSVARRRVGGFSLGMRQRLAIASALLGDPAILILDEPANGLDPAGIRWLRELLRTMAAEGRAVLLSSHVLTEIDQIADDVVIIEQGRLVAQGGKDDVTGGASLEAAFLRLTGAGA